MTAEQIRKVIARSGKSQREVARTLGISPQTLQTRLTAKSISADTIERIAAALGISPAEFYETELREENERKIMEGYRVVSLYFLCSAR